MRDPVDRTPRRVLFVNHVAKVSGAEKSLLGVLGKLDRKRFLPTAVCPEGPLADALRRLRVVHLPARLRRIRRSRALGSTLSNLIDVVSSALHLFRIIKKCRAEVVHANSTTAFLCAGPAARLAGVPVIWHVRDIVELGRLGRLLFRLADAIACVSEAVERHIAPYGGDLDKLWTVTNGIDLAAFRTEARPGSVRRELGIDENTPLISHISQITPWKGHRFLLNALGRTISEFPGLRVLLVGEAMTPQDATYHAQLRSWVESLGLTDTVVFTGWRDDVASVIADSDVVVLPSRAEPFGRAALEALALGKPVVGTNSGGLPELVSHRQTGILVDEDDTDALAEALIELLRSPETRSSMGDNGARQAERFDISRTVNQLQNLYDDLLLN